MSLTSIKDRAASQQPDGSTLLARLALATSLILLQSHLADQNLSSHIVRLQLPLCYSIQDTEDTGSRVDIALIDGLMKGDVIHLYTGTSPLRLNARQTLRMCSDINSVSMAGVWWF